jgi:hypothetical protein
MATAAPGEAGAAYRSTPAYLAQTLVAAIPKSFDSIESVQDFMAVLAATLLDVMKELNSARQEALDIDQERRARALEIALFKVKMLSFYVHKSRRALNDLRTLRRLVTDERVTSERAMAAAG